MWIVKAVAKHRRVLRLAAIASAVLIAACPTARSKPCQSSTDCSATERCRYGACGPICLDDGECGAGQVCQAGVCAPRPECAAHADCAAGFACRSGKCACTADDACGSAQRCVDGGCVARPRCTRDEDCAGSGGTCEIASGACLPRCQRASDCAPSLDPTAAGALFSCFDGACVRRCSADVQCGSAQALCQDGLCRPSQCATQEDCPVGRYCTAAASGRCLDYTPCSDDAGCPANYRCGRFTAATCPPGFDCTQALCQELARCVADADCRPVTTTTPPPPLTAFCGDGHCQPSKSCQATPGCDAGFECVTNVCVPSSCRVDGDCAASQRCLEGACQAAPPAADFAVLRLFTPRSFLVEGEQAQLRLVAQTFTGLSVPVAQANFTVVDEQGQATQRASVSSGGLLSAVVAGAITVRASVQGAAVAQAAVSLTIVPLPTGRRVIVVDEDEQPLAGAHVAACLAADCAQRLEAVTDALGIAPLPLDAGAVHVTASTLTLRSDGLPARERATLIAAAGEDLLLPLRGNPVKAATGFSGTVSFTDVHSSGSYWLGYLLASARDVTALTPARLQGDSFAIDLPGVSQNLPFPSPLVLSSSVGFGIAQTIKSRALGFAEPGERAIVAFAGRGSPEQLGLLRSVDVLSYLGAFDVDAREPLVVPPYRPLVPDTADVDGDGLCTDPARCPMGSETVPDWGNFVRTTTQPKRPQNRRTEVTVPRVAGATTSVLLLALQLDPKLGAVPLGLTQVTPGTQGRDGTRPVPTVSLRSAPPFGYFQGVPGALLALAVRNEAALSARITRGPALPARVSVQPFLPVPTGATLDPTRRTLTPAQPAFGSIRGAGGELLRASVDGSQVRHTVYTAIGAGDGAVSVPVIPAGLPGADPFSEQSSGVELTIYDLSAPATADDAFDTLGPRLTSLTEALDGYCLYSR